MNVQTKPTLAGAGRQLPFETVALDVTGRRSARRLPYQRPLPIAKSSMQSDPHDFFVKNCSR